ncbi:hypothetical protein LTR93_003275 [Exophiala xenobiotica]|nr:hypothetical protein LTR93_003275 [Exophiala xenobiotica]KAK5405702.1 hypothetical protein LTR06_008769 [Exophiala xenobiotica]
MSIIGVSSSDFVNVINSFIQAVDALRSEDGAKSHYTETEHSLESKARALRALQALLELPSLTVDTRNARSAVEDQLHDTEGRHRRLTEKYRDTLGPDASQKKHHGILAKERYSFRGEKQQREATLRAIDGYHAVMVETILVTEGMARERAKTVEESLIVLKRTLEQGLTDDLAQTVSSLNHLKVKAEEHDEQLKTVVNEAQLSIETSLQQAADQIVATNGSHNAQLMVLLQQMQQKQDSATLTIQRLIERSKAPSIPPVVGRLSSLRIMDILHSSQHVPRNSFSNVHSSLLRNASDSYKYGNMQSVQLFLNEDKGCIVLGAFSSKIPNYTSFRDHEFGEEQFVMQLQTPFAHLICLFVTLEMRLTHRIAHSEWAMLDDSSLAKATAMQIMSAVYQFTLTMPPNTAAKIARKIWLGAHEMGATNATDATEYRSVTKFLIFLFAWRDNVSIPSSPDGLVISQVLGLPVPSLLIVMSTDSCAYPTRQSSC